MQFEGGNMHWAMKSRHWRGLYRQGDPTMDRDRFAFFGASGLDIVAAWAIVMVMFLILLVSSTLS